MTYSQCGPCSRGPGSMVMHLWLLVSGCLGNGVWEGLRVVHYVAWEKAACCICFPCSTVVNGFGSLLVVGAGPVPLTLIKLSCISSCWCVEHIPAGLVRGSVIYGVMGGARPCCTCARPLLESCSIAQGPITHSHKFVITNCSNPSRSLHHTPQVAELHSRGISSFLVTNAQFPDRIQQVRQTVHVLVCVVCS